MVDGGGAEVGGVGGEIQSPHPSAALRAGFLAQKDAREMGHPAEGLDSVRRSKFERESESPPCRKKRDKGGAPGAAWGTQRVATSRIQTVWTDLQLVEQFGPFLDRRAGEETVRDLLIRKMLKIRIKKGGVRYLKLNRAQQEYSQRCSKRNIVLKARQVGMTTYIAARYFMQTITRPGTLTVQVAHSDESAQAIFKIVHRFWEKLPNARVHRGALVKSRSNVRQIVFPKLDSEYRVETADDNAGRGMTIHNLHCSEVSRWPRGGRGNAGVAAGGGGSGWGDCAGVDGERGGGNFLRRVAEGGGDGIHAALFPLVV